MIWADTSSLTAKNFADGQTADFRFRITVSGKAVDLKSFNVGTAAKIGPATHGLGTSRTFAVDHPTAPKPATSTPAAKETPAKPAAPVKEAAKPAADVAAAPAAPAAPKSTPSAAPATTAPAGTPELAQTGADTPNGLLAGIAAGIAALGAGMVLTVRRLRARR